MTTINTNTSSTTAYVLTPDTTGTFVVKTGSGAGTTAMTLDSSQNATFAGTVSSSAGTLISQGMVLLGTLTTTSGTTQTLSGLTLTGYKALYISLNNVSINSTGTVRLASINLTINTFVNTNSLWGTVIVNLSNGSFGSALAYDLTASGTISAGSSAIGGGNVGITTSSTSLVFSPSSGSFDSGTITVYGII